MFVHTTLTRTASVTILSLLPPDPTLTLHTVTTAVAPVKNWGDLGAFLGVPQAKRSEIDSEYPTVEEKKEATLDYWLCNCPVVSWDKLAGALHFQEEKQSLQYIRRYLRITAGVLVMIHCQVFFRPW